MNLESTLIDISTEQLNKHYHPIEVTRFKIIELRSLTQTKAESGSSTVFAMKRPGLEEFLSELQAYYHIYIYTHVEGTVTLFIHHLSMFSCISMLRPFVKPWESRLMFQNFFHKRVSLLTKTQQP